MGHTGLPRLGVFCQRPAPVQVTWLGYLSTTGLTRMDFRLTDARADPPAIAQPRTPSAWWRLPASQWCYRPMARAMDPCRRSSATATSRSARSTPRSRSRPRGCRRWAQVLARVPGSRLRHGRHRRPSASARPSGATRGASGVAAERIEFLPRVALDEYLELYNRVDIAFDTFPYGGGTTTSTRCGWACPWSRPSARPRCRAARPASSWKSGLDDWIAPSLERFVDVVARAADRDALAPARASCARACRPRRSPTCRASCATSRPPAPGCAQDATR